MRNLHQIIYAVNRDIGILKRLIKAQSKLIDFLLKIVYSAYCDLGAHADNEIQKLLADIKKIADETKK